MAPRRRSTACSPAGSTEEHPADVLIPIWTHGKDTTIDVTVVNPLQSGLVVKVAENRGYAVEAAHNRKVARYANRCEEEGMVFVPLAVDTLVGGGVTSRRWWSLTSSATSSQGLSAGTRELRCSIYGRGWA